jgi:hypothetical protein
MTHETTKNWNEAFSDEDLRGLALILDYANEQARKLDLVETTELIARAARTLDGRLSAHPNQVRDATPTSAERTTTEFPEIDLRAWPTPEFLGGPMILDDVA